MKSQNTDVGIQLIKKIYKDLQIDDEWSLWSARGFTWWGHNLSQRVWTERPFEGSGLDISQVQAETDLFIYPNRSADIENFLAHYLRLSALSGITVNEKGKSIVLRSSIFVHEENYNWLNALFSLAAIMQVAEAEAFCKGFSTKTGLYPAYSQHPYSGPRDKRDEILDVVNKHLIPFGQKPTERIGEEDFEEASKSLNTRNLCSTYSKNGLTAYVPFAGFSSLLQVEKNQEHPYFGNGLLYRLTLPKEHISFPNEIDGKLIMDMNLRNVSAPLAGHFIGSWCIDQRAGDPAYVTFVPAMACIQSVFYNMIFSTLNQSIFAEGYFFEYK